MKVNKTIIQKIKATEGKRYLEFTLGPDGFEELDTNLPYKKSIDDWKFYGRAITKIFKT